MIKFFRKIRHDLLSEGKTGKYLKYAFGEIILVVIGILIALSINNWNEELKSKEQLNDFMLLMLDELAQDSIFLDKSITTLNNHRQFQTLITQGKYSEVSMEEFPRMVGFSVANKNFGLTYSNLKSDGKLNLIEDIQLKKKITTYYEVICTKYNEWALYHQKFVSENIESRIVLDLPIERGFKIDADFILSEIEKGNYLSLINYQLSFIDRFIEMNHNVLEANNELRSLIKSELR